MAGIVWTQIKNCMIFALFLSTTSHACLSTDDCLFGGICDAVLLRCQCSLNCQRFANPKAVCAGKKYPMTECNALEIACELQEKVPITTFNRHIFRKTGNCKKMMSSPEVVFCEDQTLCSGNGICLKPTNNSLSFCRCVNNYTGDRCDIKQPAIIPVTTSPEESTSGIVDKILNVKTVGLAGRKFSTDPVAHLTTGMIMCAIAACIALYLRRRFVKTRPTPRQIKGEKNGTVENCGQRESETEKVLLPTSFEKSRGKSDEM